VGEQGDGLADVVPGCRDANAEAGGEFSQCLALAQVDEYEQGLLARVGPPPRRADCLAVPTKDAGQIGQRLR
jgi:hypothetical protein